MAPSSRIQRVRKVQTTFDLNTLRYLTLRGRELYAVSLEGLTDRQEQISAKHRFTLVDWLMEVSDKFQLKRQTFYLAVHYSDNYLSLAENFPLDSYQLVGITSLLIACKLEEIYFPKISDFEEITDGKCSAAEMFEMEIKILMKLQWLMNPTTLNGWMHIYMVEWDRYSHDNPLGLDMLDQNAPKYSQLGFESNSNDQMRQLLREPHRRLPKFQSDDHDDYMMFRYAAQTVDLMLLDVDSYRFDPRCLSLSSIIVVLGLTFEIFTLQDLKRALYGQSVILTPRQAKKLLSSHKHQDQRQPNFIFDNFIANLEVEFAHLIAYYAHFYCGELQAHDLRDALRYSSLFFAAAPVQG